jgi:hypothetical protein
LAAESELFVDYLSQDHATKPFTRAYVQYLQKQADDLIARLNSLEVGSGSKTNLAECIKQTEALRSILSSPALILEGHAPLIAIRSRVAETEASLQRLAKP